MALEPRKRLGRGLDALLSVYPGEPDAAVNLAQAGQRTLPVAAIIRNPRNPRREFHAEALAELAESLKQHGLVQPIVVRAAPDGEERYEIIAGERRWRAAQIAGLHELPVIVLDVSDREALELAIIENVQRADLNPVEEARGYQALLDEFEYTQGELGATIGKSRVHVTNTLRLLRLPPAVLALLESAGISAGHGRALLACDDPEALARIVVERGLSVRETERLVQAPAAAATPPAKPAKSADVRALEKELTDLLGLTVQLNHKHDAGGDLRIRYATLDQLEAVCRKLRG